LVRIANHNTCELCQYFLNWQLSDRFYFILVTKFLTTLTVFFVSFLSSLSAATVTLVDGQSFEAEVLFEHPNAPLLVLRSPAHRTVQTLPLALIHQVAGSSKTQVQNPRRALTAEEAAELEANRLWGDEAGPGQIGNYASESWEPAPVIVWAHPGESGSMADPENWLDENGQPLSEYPWKRIEGTFKYNSGRLEKFDGDMLLPAADTPYKAIRPGSMESGVLQVMRHVTLERNAAYTWKFSIHGNIWVKQGGSFGGMTSGHPGGLGSQDDNKHTFYRAAPIPELPEPAWAYAPPICHWGFIDSGESGSIEFIGNVRPAGDRMSLMRGTIILSEGSSIICGDRASLFVAKEATLIMLDDTRAGPANPLKGGSGGSMAGTYAIAGTLLFGTPERPLKRDLPFGMCYYPLEEMDNKIKASQRANGASLVLSKSGVMRVHSSDPTKARVLFQPRPKTLPVGSNHIPQEHRGKLRQVEYLGLTREVPTENMDWKSMDVPQGISAVMLGETDFDGVVFDGFYAGGLVVDPDARKKWKNVFFGENNLADSEAIFGDPDDVEKLNKKKK
jgi:hypothetical protein